MMLRTTLAAGAVLALLASPALANSCPRHMAAIDAALAKNPQLSTDQLAQVKKLRAEGEEQHKTGRHKESEDSLVKAQGILGIK